LVLLGLLLLGVVRLFEPATWALATAVRELGPVTGWRCAQSGTDYIYDPRRDRPDSGLLSEAPEELLSVAVPQVTVERVETNLRGGDSVVWARVGADDEGGQRRVYVLSPGRMQAVTFDFASGPATVCYSHLGDWRIIAEHALG
jgi:hypothetical protein